VSGAEGVEAYGLDASPALSVIAGALGAVGPKPDLVLSGINHGVNVGRSVLHSGTVGRR
jgi:5'-nucleotidase